MAALNLPLVMRKVPMNRFYGFRTEVAFRSEQAWYDVNASGGWTLLLTGILMVLLGLAGFHIPEQYRSAYDRYAPLIVVGLISLALLRFVLWSRRYGG